MGNLFLTIVGSLIILIPCLILEVIHRSAKKKKLQNRNTNTMSSEPSNRNTNFAKTNSVKDEVIYISKSDYDYL